MKNIFIKIFVSLFVAFLVQPPEYGHAMGFGGWGKGPARPSYQNPGGNVSTPAPKLGNCVCTGNCNDGKPPKVPNNIAEKYCKPQYLCQKQGGWGKLQYVEKRKQVVTNISCTWTDPSDPIPGEGAPGEEDESIIGF